MSESFIYIVIIPMVLSFLYALAGLLRESMVGPIIKDNVQKIGGFHRLVLNGMLFMTLCCAVLSILGTFMRDTEMTIAFGVITLIFMVITFMMNRKLNITYQETNEYFIYTNKGKEFKVFYDEITDWDIGFNGIWIIRGQDETRESIEIDVRHFMPEILLRKITEMTFEEKFFPSPYESYGDPYRKSQIVDFLVNNQYGYLIEDYLDK